MVFIAIDLGKKSKTDEAPTLATTGSNTSIPHPDYTAPTPVSTSTDEQGHIIEDPMKAQTDLPTQIQNDLGAQTESAFAGADYIPTREEMLAPKNDGSNYQPGGGANENNKAIYDTQGNPLMGVEGLPRTTAKFDDKGNKSTEFVMPPELGPDSNDPMHDIARSAARTGGYAASQTIKHGLGLGEWIFDNLQTVFGINADASVGGVSINPAKGIAKLGNWLLNTDKFTDTEKNWIDENFATLPAGNGTEKFVGDIMSMVVGGGVGKKVGEKALEAVPGAVTKVVSRFWNEAKRVDPVNAHAKTEAFVKSIAVSIPSEAAGFAATTPSNTESMFGNPLLDNLALAYGGTAIAKVAGAAGRGIAEKFTGGFKNKATPNNAMKAFMNHIDEGTLNASDEEIARRAKILGEIANKNSTFETGLKGVMDGSIQLDTTTAMSMQDAAREYFEKAYAFRKGQIPDAQLNQMIENESQALIEKLRGIKKARVMGKSSIVENKDSDLYAQTENLMTEKADNMQLEGDVHSNMAGMVQPKINELEDVRNSLKNASNNKEVADAALVNEQTNNDLIRNLEDARSKNLLGFNTENRANLLNLSKEGLVKAWTKAKDVVNHAYSNIARTPPDYQALAESIANAGDLENSLRVFNVRAPANPVGPIGNTVEDFNQLVNNLQEAVPDINYLYTKIRPEISQRINQAETSGVNVETVDGLKALRAEIDRQANASDEPTVQAAVKAYKDFADNWLQTPELKAFDDAMDTVRDVGPEWTPKGLTNAKIIGKEQVLDKAISDTTGERLPKLLSALDDPTASDTIQKYVFGEILGDITTSMTMGQPAQVTNIISRLRPYRDLMKAVDPSLEADFARSVEALAARETDAVGADRTLNELVAKATKLKNEASQTEASKWIRNLDGANDLSKSAPELTSNSRETFYQLFASKEAAGDIPKLMAEAKATGNPLVVEGIQSQYLRYIKDTHLSSKSVGVDTAGGELSFPKAPRAGTLNQTLNTSKSNVLNTIKSVLDPEDAAGVEAILQFLDTKVNLDTAKAFTAGSDTVMNNASAQQSTQLLTRIMFGPLNRKASLINSIAQVFNAGWQGKADKAALDMLDMFITDPKFLSKTAAMMKKGADDGSIINFLKGIKAASGPIVIGTVGAHKSTTEPAIDQETNSMLSSPISFSEHVKTGERSDTNIERRK